MGEIMIRVNASDNISKMTKEEYKKNIQEANTLTVRCDKCGCTCMQRMKRFNSEGERDTMRYLDSIKNNTFVTYRAGD